MQMDWMRNLEVGIRELLEDGINLLIYAREYDFICDWLGYSRWVHAMEWLGHKQFTVAPTTSFSVNGTEAGQLKTHGPLTFLKVHYAGHFVPMDQPKAALEIVQEVDKRSPNSTEKTERNFYCMITSASRRKVRNDIHTATI